jgi:hypothetical protein
MIYAGLDIDGVVKLFTLDKNKEPHAITREHWITILESQNAQMGEMLQTKLFRENHENNNSF